MVRKSKKKREVEKRIKGRKSETGRHSKYMKEFKRKTGLVSMDEIKELPIGSVEALKQKVALMDEYAVANQKLVDLFGSVGGRVVNSLNQVIDLQGKLLLLERKCEEEGLNPLENPDWVKARKMLSDEIQFVHKHGLDAADVQSKVEARKRERDDDVLFTIEKNEEEEDDDDEGSVE